MKHRLAGEEPAERDAVQATDQLRVVPNLDAVGVSRAMQFAVGAASRAVTDSGLDLTKENPENVGVVMGTGIIPIDLSELSAAIKEAFDDEGKLQTRRDLYNLDSRTLAAIKAARAKQLYKPKQKTKRLAAAR